MQVAKEIFSQDKHYKAVVARRNDRLFHIDVYLWDEEWETWLEITQGFSLFDTEEATVDSAWEHLRNFTGETGEEES